MQAPDEGLPELGTGNGVTTKNKGHKKGADPTPTMCSLCSLWLLPSVHAHRPHELVDETL
jgi:hypothetical protein